MRLESYESKIIKKLSERDFHLSYMFDSVRHKLPKKERVINMKWF